MNYSFDFEAKEAENIQVWLSSKRINFEEGFIEQKKIKKQIEEMIDTFDEFPEDKKRVDNIINEIKKTNILLPIYIEKNDNCFFVMEGRHRMCAQYILKINNIPTLFCSKEENYDFNKTTN